MGADKEDVNPFSAPVAEVVDPAQQHSANGSSETLGQIAKRVFLAWEKLRVLYILILGLFTLLLGLPYLNKLEFWLPVIFGGVIANACFFLGPIIETYVTWLGFRGRWLRWVIFVLGTLFTMAGSAATILLPGAIN